MKIFSYDGILAQAIRYIWNLFALNICFVICCLPIVTIGAAITALYSVYLNESLEQGKIRQFFRAFKDNFRQATLIWLVFMALAVVLGIDAYLLLTFKLSGSSILKVLVLIVTVVILSVESFIFPLVAHYENTTKQTWRNALVLGVTLMIYGIIMSAISLLPLILFFIDLDLMVCVLAVWLPFGNSLSAQINSWILKHVFTKLQPKDSDANAS